MPFQFGSGSSSSSSGSSGSSSSGSSLFQPKIFDDPFKSRSSAQPSPSHVRDKDRDIIQEGTLEIEKCLGEMKQQLDNDSKKQ